MLRSWYRDRTMACICQRGPATWAAAVMSHPTSRCVEIWPKRTFGINRAAKHPIGGYASLRCVIDNRPLLGLRQIQLKLRCLESRSELALPFAARWTCFRAVSPLCC